MNPQLPPKLGEIIDKALEKNCSLRYQSAADLCSDLKRLKRDTESGALIAHAAPPASRGMTRRTKRLIAVASAFLILALAAIPLWRWTRLRPGSTSWLSEQKNVVVLPFRAISAEAQDRRTAPA